MNSRLATGKAISVVIPAKNESKYVAQCLQALTEAAPDDVSAELLLVDNGSDDDTTEIAGENGAKVIRKLGGTISSVRNAGAAASHHELIAFVDADCAVQPGWYESVFAQFEDAEVVAAGCYPQAPRSGVSWVHRTFVAIATQPPGPPGPTDWLPSANMVVRKAAFQAVNGFDEQMITAEDADLAYRLAAHGKVMNNHQMVMIHYREPATLRELFLKEMWRGLGSYDGVSKGRWTLSEMPSLIAPLITITGVTLVMFGLLRVVTTGFFPAIAWIGVGLWLFVPIIYSLRAIRGRAPVGWLHKVFAVYCVYHLARACSFFKWLAMSRRTVA